MLLWVFIATGDSCLGHLSTLVLIFLCLCISSNMSSPASTRFMTIWAWVLTWMVDLDGIIVAISFHFPLPLLNWRKREKTVSFSLLVPIRWYLQMYGDDDLQFLESEKKSQLFSLSPPSAFAVSFSSTVSPLLLITAFIDTHCSVYVLLLFCWLLMIGKRWVLFG